MKIIIIGLGSAGFAAALAIKKISRNAEVIIIDNKDYDLLHPCGLTFVLEGRVKSFDKIKHDLNLKSMDIKKIKGKATKIDVKNKVVEIDNEKKESYDKLIIATGSSAFVPDIEGKELAHTVHTIESTTKLKKEIKKGKKAVIVGASAIGLETAIALKANGLDVTIVDMLPGVFPKALDEDMSNILIDILKEKNIKFVFNERIKKIGKNKAYFENENIESDIVVLATGVRPNLDIIKDTPIKATKAGILVDEKMQTNIKNIYAVGDCVQARSLITSRPFVAQIATTAFKQGTIAGTNAAGGDLVYEGLLGTFVSVVGNIEVAATGFNEFFAAQNKIKTISSRVKSTNLPDWFPGKEEIYVKILADAETGEIIGGQAIGHGASSRINVLSTAIKAGFTLQKLSEVELAYCPAVSQVYDILLVAADLCNRKLTK